MLVVLDIDLSIADNTHREHHLQKSPKDWDSFFKPELVLKDTPIPEAQRVVREMQRLRYHIVALTARNESLRDVTMRWLLEHFNLDTDDNTLLMRPQNNMQRGHEFKGQAMQTLLAEYKNRGENSFIFIEDNGPAFEVFATEGLVLRAPECWSMMFPIHVVPEVTNG